MTQPEARIVKAVQQTIASLGGYSVKTHGGMYGRAGTPDVLACIDGRMFALEVKTATGKASPRQLYELRRWQRSGAVAAIVRSEADVRALASGASVDDATMERHDPRQDVWAEPSLMLRKRAMYDGLIATIDETIERPACRDPECGCNTEQDGVTGGDGLPPIPACSTCGEAWECECQPENAVEIRLTADAAAFERDLARVRLGLKPDANW